MPANARTLNQTGTFYTDGLAVEPHTSHTKVYSAEGATPPATQSGTAGNVADGSAKKLIKRTAVISTTNDQGGTHDLSLKRSSRDHDTA